MPMFRLVARSTIVSYALGFDLNDNATCLPLLAFRNRADWYSRFRNVAQVCTIYRVETPIDGEIYISSKSLAFRC